MKAKRTYRPARRIPADRLAHMRAVAAAKAQAREDAYQQRIAPVEEFAAAPRLTMLPGGLHWSSQAPVPAIGATVAVSRAGHIEQAEVKGYCHAAGFLGLVTETTRHTKTGRRNPLSARANCVFGSQLAIAA
ncbi:hypothetical protein [Hymenobacter guriensis]|uniref:Amidase n=1 Tax=Hymenobacter guriensis TaxID=2793065 RepID=A0ABS0L7F9_9BACT|nr:hypothetical protein [Hymenobacter guriensis]MBG8556046.1 hypothetical protein [Hymenobacter guriensis]